MEYIVDGYSGTNTNRPMFMQMQKDIGNGLIDCIIVKDLSRLGRNYIDVGEFVQECFKDNVRIIAINSNFDSSNNNFTNIEFSFTNLFNQLYVKDLVRKSKSSRITKMKRGEFLSSFAIFGYEKSKIEKNKLVLDKVSSKYVKLIFKLALEGYTNRKIAQILNEKNIPTPSTYKKNQGALLSCNTKVDENFWNNQMVRYVLSDERYTGKLISYTSTVINSTKHKIPKDKWIIVPNTHEGIISEEDFYRVLKIHTDNRNMKDNTNILKNKVICPYCNYCMERVGKKKTAYYRCKTSKFTNKFNCKDNKTLDIDIRTIIVSNIQLLLQTIIDKETVQSETEKKGIYNLKDKENKLIEIKNYKKKLEEKITNNYLNYVSEKVDKALFIKEKARLKDIFDSEYEKEKLMIEDINNYKTELAKRKKLMEIYSSILDIETLNKEKVNLLIDKIYIYDYNKINIVWYDKINN